MDLQADGTGVAEDDYQGDAKGERGNRAVVEPRKNFQAVIRAYFIVNFRVDPERLLTWSLIQKRVWILEAAHCLLYVVYLGKRCKIYKINEINLYLMAFIYCLPRLIKEYGLI